MFHLIAVLLASLPWLLDSAPAFAIPITAIIAGAIGISAGTVGYAVIGAFVNLAISTGLSMLAKAFSPKRSSALSVQPTQVTVIEPLADRRLVYGRTRVPGTIIYLTTSENNQYLHYVIALCEGPVDAIETVYLNDDALVLDGSGNATTGTWAGKARVRIYDGTQTAADSLLVAESGGQWTTSHIGYGIAYLYVRLKYDSSVAAMGRPNITAVVRGLKVFDPRTSVTAWSANPALCLRDYLIRTRAKGGVGVNDPVTASAPILTFIDDANFIAQANICDETVALNGGGTEKRYECHGYFDLSPDNEPQERAQRFLSAMAGKPDPQAGLWRVYAGAWRGSSFSITDDHIVGSITVTTRRSLSQQFNAIKGAYLSPESRWTASDYPAITSSAFEAEDGGNRVYKDLDLPFTTSVSMAQRIAKIALYRSRLQMSVTMKCSLAVYAVAIGDVVSVTHDRWGWTAKTFEVTDWSMDLYEGTIALSMRETSAAVYSWSATEEQLRQSSSPTTLPNWSLVAAPSIALAAGDAELLIGNDGSVISRMKVSITGDGNAFIDKWAVQWKKSADTTWNEPVVIQATASSALHWISPIDDGNLYDVRVRAGNALGAVSPWASVTSFLALGKSAPPTDVASVQLTNGLLSWSYPTPPADFAGFRVKYQSGAYPFWANAGLVTDGLVTTTSIDVSSYLSGPVTLMVKSVDTSGNEATNAAIIVTNLGDYLTSNVVLNNNLKAAGFQGLINSGSVVGGNLVGPVLGYYWQANDTAAFWQQSGATFWTADVYGPVEWIATIVPEMAYLDATLSLSSTIAGAPYAISYRTGGSALQWQGADTGAYWAASNTTTYWAAQGDWLPWPGSVGSLKRQAYEIRTTIVGGSIQPVISAFTAVFDVPDISEQIANAAILTGGSRLAVTKSYRAITNVNVTLQGSTGGAVSVSVEDKLATGPLVKVMNSSGGSVAGTIDAIIQGY